MLELQECLSVMYDLHSPPPMGHLQLSTSHKTDRGNERWGIYLPSWHCLFLPGELWINTFIKVLGWDLHLLRGRTAERGLCVMCFCKSTNWNECWIKRMEIKRWHHHSYHLCIYTKGQRDNWNEHSNRNSVCIFIVIHLQWAHFNSVCLV